MQLKKNLQEIKNNIKQIKSEISKKEKDNEVNSNTIPIETNEDNSTNNNNLSPRNNKNEKSTPKLKLQSNRHIPILNFSKSIEGVKLPSSLPRVIQIFQKLKKIF